MAIQHPVLIRNALCDLVTRMLDLGDGPGKLVLQTAAGQTVATLIFGVPAFAAAIDGVAVANEIAADISAIGGTVTRASARDGFDNEIFSCRVTVFGNGGDIELSSVMVPPGQTVSLSSLTYTALL
jgi:hypothetical protein